MMDNLGATALDSWNYYYLNSQTNNWEKKLQVVKQSAIQAMKMEFGLLHSPLPARSITE